LREPLATPKFSPDKKNASSLSNGKANCRLIVKSLPNVQNPHSESNAGSYRRSESSCYVTECGQLKGRLIIPLDISKLLQPECNGN